MTGARRPDPQGPGRDPSPGAFDLRGLPAPVSPNPADAFFLAVTRGDVLLVRAELAAGIDVNARNHDGWHAVHVAINHDHLDLALELLARGARPDDALPEGTTLYKDVQVDMPARIARLLGHPDPQAMERPGGNGAHPLTWAVAHHRPALTAWLLAHGADPDRPDGNGRTARTQVDGLIRQHAGPFAPGHVPAPVTSTQPSPLSTALAQRLGRTAAQIRATVDAFEQGLVRREQTELRALLRDDEALGPVPDAPARPRL